MAKLTYDFAKREPHMSHTANYDQRKPGQGRQVCRSRNQTQTQHNDKLKANIHLMRHRASDPVSDGCQFSHESISFPQREGHGSRTP